MHSEALTRRLQAALLAIGLAGAAALAGCDVQRITSLEVGVSGEADVKSQWGEPERVYEEGDSRVFEYNRQPAGRVNYMIVIGPDGKLRAMRQVLKPENFAKVQPGMTGDEVRRILGKPRAMNPFPLKNETIWEWGYNDSANQPMVFEAVMSPSGTVLRSASVVENASGAAGR